MSGEDRRRVVPGSRARLFFALWPPDVARGALAAVGRELRECCGGRAIPADRIHLTLAFLGDTPRDLIPRLAADAGRVEARAFDLIVDHAGYWRHNRIAWAGVARCPEPLSGLVGELGRSLAAVGRCPDDRVYVPHITLVRDARRSPGRRRLEPLSWPVSSFALVESLQGGSGLRYEVLREWPLRR